MAAPRYNLLNNTQNYILGLMLPDGNKLPSLRWKTNHSEENDDSVSLRAKTNVPGDSNNGNIDCRMSLLAACAFCETLIYLANELKEPNTWVGMDNFTMFDPRSQQRVDPYLDNTAGIGRDRDGIVTIRIKPANSKRPAPDFPMMLNRDFHTIRSLKNADSVMTPAKISELVAISWANMNKKVFIDLLRDEYKPAKYLLNFANNGGGNRGGNSGGNRGGNSEPPQDYDEDIPF